ncbi:MAG: hypothetical protein ACREDF_08930, partial [Thermoplasmata archaeon]
MPIPKGFRETKFKGVRCAAGSHRTKIVSKNTRLIICCPRGPGHWKRGRCSVGTRAVAKLT